MNDIKYDGLNPNDLGPAVLGLYDLLNRGHITRQEFNRLICRAEADDDLISNASQCEKENRF